MARLNSQQFAQLLTNVSKSVRYEMEMAVGLSASELAMAMVFNAPKGKGDLANSVRVESGRHRLRKLVRAGGVLTTNKSGYDYAIANEFGTQKMGAQPFFWTTYRANKRKIRAKMASRVKVAVARVIDLS